MLFRKTTLKKPCNYFFKIPDCKFTEMDGVYLWKTNFFTGHFLATVSAYWMGGTRFCAELPFSLFHQYLSATILQYILSKPVVFIECIYFLVAKECCRPLFYFQVWELQKLPTHLSIQILIDSDGVSYVGAVQGWNVCEFRQEKVFLSLPVPKI